MVKLATTLVPLSREGNLLWRVNQSRRESSDDDDGGFQHSQLVIMKLGLLLLENSKLESKTNLITKDVFMCHRFKPTSTFLTVRPTTYTALAF